MFENKRPWGVVALILGGLAFAPEASAHHSFAMFDPAKTVEITGTVREFQWTNPHSWIQVQVPGKTAGSTVEWSIELPTGPGGLRRKGWKPNTIRPGDKVTIKMHPLRDGTPGGSLMSVTVPGGKVFQ